MSGKEKIKVYEYSQDGKYLRNYESISDYAKEKDISDNVLSDNGRTFYHIYECKEGNIASTTKIGRKGVLRYKFYRDSVFVGHGKQISEGRLKESNKGMVVLYDLDGDKIAVFKSVFQAKLLTGWDDSLFIVPFGKLKRTRRGVFIEVKKQIK